MVDKSPYDDLIMDHIKNARNYFMPCDANRMATGTNPLCGDNLTIYLTVVSDKIKDIAFQCTCCGISMASASIMTELMKGRDTHDAENQLQAFTTMLHERPAASSRVATREQIALLDTVQKFPPRKDCAALPWATLEKAIGQQQHPISDR